VRAPRDVDHPDEADAELDELFELLDLNDEWLTGFFAAFYVGPDLVKPSGWLPRVMGDHAFFDDDEARWGLDILMDFYNGVGELNRDFPEKVCPPADDPESVANFCNGFVEGSSLQPSWKTDDEALVLLFILDALAGNVDDTELVGVDEKPMTDPEGWRQSHREKLTEHFMAMRAHWTAKRSRATSTGSRAKVGRNDPCPCGSGKKYKKCCLPT
jgi:uncharacterized protein